ncbi:MFS transporter [Kyrpidia spormannii]|uniref:MFS transporter n=1 Tax=Kyrpidia spormannii TaxID=2055160 RepID=A0ACA8Z5G6_9BACL|nr:MFS transporter [Kyrpidia spormannii]CAB3389541.1 MFS transporter [Kyrpidia spormannii]
MIARNLSSEMKRAIVGGTIGTVIEWYDFAAYGFLAAILGKVFFPSQNPTVSLLASFATFGVAFFMRPIGGILFGSLGDRFGRRSAFTWSIILMSCLTFLIGCLPTYASIGIAAPALLVLLRLLQALCAGGELTGAYTFVGEYASTKRRGYESSWTEAGAISGFLLGSLCAFVLSATLSQSELVAWGWRIPFWCAAPLGAVGVYLRMRMGESPAFEVMKEKGLIVSAPIGEAVRYSRVPLFQAFGIAIYQNVGIYIILTYMPTYFTTQLHFSQMQSMLSSVISMALAILFMPIAGAWSDRVGRRRVLGWSCGIALVLTYPLFLLMSQHNFGLALLAHVATSILVGIFLGPIPATMAELFPTNIRYGGMSLAYNISVAVFGGFAPFIATYLIASTKNPLSPSYYVIGSAVLTLITLASMVETSRTPLKENANAVPSMPLGMDEGMSSVEEGSE